MTARIAGHAFRIFFGLGAVRMGWLVLIWAVSVAALGVVAMALRGWLA